MVKDLTIQVLIKKVEELARRIDRSEKENKILHFLKRKMANKEARKGIKDVLYNKLKIQIKL